MNWTVTTPGHWRSISRHEFLGHLTAHVTVEYDERGRTWTASAGCLFVVGEAATIDEAKSKAMCALCDAADNLAAEIHAAKQQEAKS